MADGSNRKPLRRSDVPGIVARGLTRHFRGGIIAVDGIDLTVRRGEIYGFLGPNGAGKSTTVHMLTTLLPPTSGRALVGGYDVLTEGQKVRRVIGAALQEVALDPMLTGREHMRLQGALQGMAKAEALRRGDELLERVGLAEAANRKTGGYSGGMKRRLDLALALVHSPRMLFLDEPTSGLDVQSRTALWEEVRRLASEGVTILLTTQYLEEADVLANRVGIIHRGRIVAEGRPAELKAQIGKRKLDVTPAGGTDRRRLAKLLERFGTVEDGVQRGAVGVRLDDPEHGLAQVVRALDRDGIDISNLEMHSPTLDDVFLAKTGTSLEGAGEPAGNGGEPVPDAAPRDRGRR